MREILFRGKGTNGTHAGEWVFGYYCKNFWDRSDHGILPVDKKDGGYVEVAPETVGQFTGLPDKNGKMIFDGDIVISTNERRLSNKACVVRFHPLSGYWMLGPKREPVVIGNIYDNPELMGGADNG